MPKVKVESFNINGQYFNIQINVGTKDGLFSTSHKYIPKQLLEGIRTKYDTEKKFSQYSECYNYIKGYLQFSVDLVEIKSCVILLEFKIHSGTSYRMSDKQVVRDCLKHSDRSSGINGFSFTPIFALKTNVGDVISYEEKNLYLHDNDYVTISDHYIHVYDNFYFTYGKGKINDYRKSDFIELDFTRENYDFLQAMINGTVGLAEKMFDFFNTGKEDLQLKISQGQKLIGN